MSTTTKTTATNTKESATGTVNSRRLITRIPLPLVAIFLLLTVLSGCQASNNNSDADPFLAAILEQYPDLEGHPYEVDHVKRVVDGDTLETRTGHKVRLIGADTPEVHGKVEAYGKEASEFSKAQLTDKKIYLFTDTGDTDRYGRLLRYVFIDQDTTMFNERLIAEGYANTMTIAPNVMYADMFAKRERQARADAVGLWGDAGNSDSTDKTTNKPTSKPTNKPASSNNAAGCAKPEIKGNINAKNEKIYHIPGGSSYEQTVAEEMFCTEAEAEAAGFRKAKR